MNNEVFSSTGTVAIEGIELVRHRRVQPNLVLHLTVTWSGALSLKTLACIWSNELQSFLYTVASPSHSFKNTVNLISTRSSHLVGDHCIGFGVTAVAAACSFCHDHVFPSCPDFSSVPRAQAAREHRWRHMEHLLFECQCIPGLDSSVALALLRDDFFRVCSGSDHAEAVLLAAFPTSRIPGVAATACVVPFLLDPAAALGRMCPWHMKLQCLDLVAVFLLVG